MLRRQAVIRASFVSVLTYIMRKRLFTDKTFIGVSNVVIHLSLENLKNEPEELLLDILELVFQTNEAAFSYLIDKNNSAIQFFMKD